MSTHSTTSPTSAAVTFSATAGKKPPRIADHMQRDQRNVFATMAVFAGIASWVPLVIVLAFPLTYLCALLALITAVRKDRRRGLKAAWVGVILATVALVIHVSFTVAGLMLSYIVPALRNLMLLGSS